MANLTDLLTALSGKIPEKVPQVEFWIDPHVMERFLGRRFLFDKEKDFDFWIKTIPDQIEFFDRAGYGYIRADAGYPIKNTDASIFEHRGYISSRAEFENFNWPSIEDINTAHIKEASRLLPEGMGIIGGVGEIFAPAWQLMGLETFCLLLYEDESLVTALIDRLGEYAYHAARRIASMDKVVAIISGDDLAYSEALMVSPRIYKKYIFPWFKKIIAVCHENNKPFIFHSDGYLWEVLDDLMDIGIDALHPIEPKAMDIIEVKKKVGGKICVAGNVDVDLLIRGTPDEVRRQTYSKLELLSQGGGYCISSSNSIPEAVKIENYKAMLETIWEFNKVK